MTSRPGSSERRYSGGVYMIPVRLSSRREFTPVPSHGSVFVYMILAKMSLSRSHYRAPALRDLPVGDEK